MKIFVSYTSSDSEWAHWIGFHLRADHTPFVHEWEVGAGENIPRWMEERLREADRLLGVFSDAFCEALVSQSEIWAAYWQDPGGRSGFLVPVEVRKVRVWPIFVEPLKRLSLIDVDEAAAEGRLLTFLQPPKKPSAKPRFPGEAKKQLLFAEGSEPLGSDPPSFPPLMPKNRSRRRALAKYSLVPRKVQAAHR
jgi:hypothetical protein